MNSLFEWGCTRGCTTDAELNDSWYISHHAVDNPNKREKMRMVYDWSTEFQARSLNKQLLSGSDLMNRIVGVLWRFKENGIAFMAEREHLFYQVIVSKEDRCCLNNQIIDCQINVPAFCARFPFIYNNCALGIYLLRRWIIQVSETFQQNFYVDDFLKSVKNEEQAIELIENIKLMRNAGGFNITKFLSNSKAILKTIPA